MMRNAYRYFALALHVAAMLSCYSHSTSAQGFDPSKVDWEALSKIPMRDGFIDQFNEQCAVCHGEDLRGAALGTPLVGIDLRHGESVEQIARNIADGFPKTGMPAWSETLDENQIWNLALYVAEQRQGTTILDKRADIPLIITEGVVTTEKHRFRIERIAEGLDPMPFSIEPLPDGRILVSERMRGLSIITPGGDKFGPIEGTPRVYDDSGIFLGQVMGLGWMLDVAIHPDYEKNGWIYIHHTDRCSDCNDLSRRGSQPVSMNRLVRGRIAGNSWVDEEIIWQADIDTYTNTSDLAAGGRIAFDNENHVFISVGMKAPLDFMGIQDLDLPYGKIHRLHDDGRIPADNPFVDTPGAMQSIWTYGHRSVQGLEFNPQTGEIWSTEMGPRGGDELNRLVAGGNYGWPVFTTGVNYDGRPVDVADKLGLALEPEDVEFPVVDMTPSPAISSFIFYDGPEFPHWKNNIIVGTLRATDLMRMEIADNKVVHTETLLTDLARFRDIETGPNGELYVLLEHATGGQIVRLVPVAAQADAAGT
jgi:glucose/arabinose dehydrogenase